ncbi:MAG: GNAT family N-acetyltransferase [Actinobacteria bacterium]|nr:GNAT family N-acetyltransferase [Actinomycetota bacterium]
MSVPPIASERLELVSLSPAILGALLGGRRDEASALLGAALPDGWPDEHDAGFLRRRLEQMQRDPEVEQWAVRGLVLTGGSPRPLIGHAGFHGPPGVNGPGAAEAVEVGYTVFPPWRGRGLATEAVVSLLDWVRSERGIRHVVASVAPGNEPSLALVRRLGFVQTGEQWDEEDGLELVFELGERRATPP